MYFLLHFYRPCATIAVSIEDLRMCAGMGADKKLKNFVIKTAVKTFLIVLAVAVAGFIIFNFAFPQHMASFAERVGNYDMALKYASLRYSYTGSTDDLARCFEDAILAGDDEAILEYGDEFFENVKGIAGRLSIAVSEVLCGEFGKPAVALVECGKRFQVKCIVAVGMIGIGAKEAIELQNGAGSVVVLIVDVRQINLSLLSVRAERIASFELGIVVARHFPGAFADGRTGFGVKLIGGPIAGRIDFNGLQPGAAAQGDCRAEQGNFCKTH